MRSGNELIYHRQCHTELHLSSAAVAVILRCIIYGRFISALFARNIRPQAARYGTYKRPVGPLPEQYRFETETNGMQFIFLWMWPEQAEEAEQIGNFNEDIMDDAENIATK